jgi:hypothetical protein
VEQLDNPVALDELLHRTPAYFVAQQEPWPAHCGDYWAVVAAPPTAEEVARRAPNMNSDIEAMRARLEIPPEQLQFELQRERDPTDASCVTPATPLPLRAERSNNGRNARKDGPMHSALELLW